MEGVVIQTGAHVFTRYIKQQLLHILNFSNYNKSTRWCMSIRHK